MKVYVATRWAQAPFVETVVAPALTSRGLRVCSTWHAPPHREDERLDDMPLSVVREIADKNDGELANADAVLVIADDRCRETWAEARVALACGIPVVVVRASLTLPLTAYREGVTRVQNLTEAIDTLAGWARGQRALAITADGEA